jgi:hypothetical protein
VLNGEVAILDQHGGRDVILRGGPVMKVLIDPQA